MKKWIKGFLTGILVATFVLVGFTVFATGGVKEAIEVVINGVNINIDGEKFSSIGESYENESGKMVPYSILYDGTTYLPIRKVAGIFDKEIGWEGQTSTISLGQSEVIVVEEETGEDEIEWIVAGFESDYPYKEYEYKYVNGEKTPEYRYTGNLKKVDAFRGLFMGECRSQVISNEGKDPDYEKDGVCAYYSKIQTFDTYLYYYINDQDQLYSIMNAFVHKHTNKTEFIDDYYRVQAGLIEKFGKPTSEDKIWYDDLWKNSPSDYGIAISTGDLTYLTLWEFDEYKISLILTGDNFDIDFYLAYTSNTYKAPKEDSGF